jgi:phosphoribosylanthranilate isomerase
MAAEDPTKAKICGITQLSDAELATELGAWAIGMVFYERSPRCCSLQSAEAIAAAMRRRVELCGVFVNAPMDEIVSVGERLHLTLLQLHGDEGPAFCAEAARRTGCKVIKAARVRSRADIQALASFHTDYHLLDSFVPGVPGGSGEAFAWEIARAHRGSTPVILSGGLHAGNVAEAIAVVRPFAVDVASGVEAGPGRKDPEKLEEFAAAVHATAALATR